MKPNQVFDQFYADLSNGKLNPFYFLYGDEEFLLNKNYLYLIDQLLTDSAKEFNFHIFDSQNFNAESILDTYNMYPMMSAHRIIVIKDLESISDTEFLGISEIFKNPNPSTITVFLAGTVDKKKKVFAQVSKAAYTIEFKKPFENQIAYWIKYMCKEREIEISDSACDILHFKIGSHLRSIDKEIQKLKDYVGTKNRIEENDVETVVTDQVRSTLFQFIDQWAERDLQRQLKIIELLDQSGESEFGFLSLLTRHFRILYSLKSHIEQKRPKDDFLRTTRTPSFFYDKYHKQARSWTLADLENQLAEIYTVSNLMKKNGDLSRAYLSKLVIDRP